MALSINPVAKLVSNVSSSISTAAADAGNAFSQAGVSLDKVNISQVTSQLSSIGSTLASADIAGAVGGIADQAQSLVSKVGTVAGSISSISADVATSIDKLGLGNLAGGLGNLATQISKAAGQLNNLLSLKRAGNLPANGELFQSRGALIEVTPVPSNDWRVRLGCNFDLFNSTLLNNTVKQTGGMVWPYLPNITVSSKANYTSIEPTHNNYPFQAYKNSVIDDISISGEFSCETESDAYYWIGATTFLRTVTKMFFGQGTNAGNPPAICQLTGYGSSIFNTVPVIVKSFSVDLKDDVNYIKVSTPYLSSPTWVPIMSTVTAVVTPIYNRSKLRDFSLEQFSDGKLVGFL